MITHDFVVVQTFFKICFPSFVEIVHSDTLDGHVQIATVKKAFTVTTMESVRTIDVLQDGHCQTRGIAI